MALLLYICHLHQIYHRLHTVYMHGWMVCCSFVSHTQLDCSYHYYCPCSELRSVALPLVGAFGIPDHILRAPIGLANTGASDVYKEYLLAAGFE